MSPASKACIHAKTSAFGQVRSSSSKGTLTNQEVVPRLIAQATPHPNLPPITPLIPHQHQSIEHPRRPYGPLCPRRPTRDRIVRKEDEKDFEGVCAVHYGEGDEGKDGEEGRAADGGEDVGWEGTEEEKGRGEEEEGGDVLAEGGVLGVGGVLEQPTKREEGRVLA
jgi:hypothetical protein